MQRQKFLKLLIHLAAGFGISMGLCACDLSVSSKAESKNMDNNKPAIVFIGQDGSEMTRQNKGSNNKQPAGLTFHNLDWNQPPFGTVIVQNGAQTVQLDTVFNVMGTSDGEYDGGGIAELNIDLGISPAEFITHEDAHKAVFSFMDKLLALGWQRFFNLDTERLAGKDAGRYWLKRRYLYDAHFRPSFSEWMAADDTNPLNVDLYANGVILTLHVIRRTRHLKVEAPLAQYTYNMVFQSVNELKRNYLKVGNMDKAQRAEWKKQWPQKRDEMFRIRAEGEAKLQAQGYRIDKSYADPAEMLNP